MKTEKNIRIAWYEQRAEKPLGTIVFLHGLGGDSSSWNDIRSKFNDKRYNTVVVDLRGHGYSSRPESVAEKTLFTQKIKNGRVK